MEEKLHVKLHVVPIGEEYLSQEENKHFHTALVDDHITINFELVKKTERKFRIRDDQIADKVS